MLLIAEEIKRHAARVTQTEKTSVKKWVFIFSPPSLLGCPFLRIYHPSRLLPENPLMLPLLPPLAASCRLLPPLAASCRFWGALSPPPYFFLELAPPPMIEGPQRYAIGGETCRVFRVLRGPLAADLPLFFRNDANSVKKKRVLT